MSDTVKTYRCKVVGFSTLNVSRYTLRGPKGHTVTVYQGWFYPNTRGATTKVFDAMREAHKRATGEDHDPCLMEHRYGEVWVDLTLEEMLEVKAAHDEYNDKSRRR